MFDFVIIGGGAAGYSAAISARQRNKTVCILRPEQNETWLSKAGKIHNYLGMPDISGKDLLAAFEQHVLDMGAEIKFGIAKQIMKNGDSFFISTGPDYIEARSVVVATGVRQPKQIPGEAEFVGNGVSYCGTCDGMLYKGKVVAVVAESIESIKEVDFLSSIAEKVYLSKGGIAFDFLAENVEVISGKVMEILGDETIQSILVGDQNYKVDGVFIFRNTTAYSSLLADLETEGNYIKTDRHMHTNIKGIFAAGDCTGEPLQIAKAVGEGNIAVLAAIKEKLV